LCGGETAGRGSSGAPQELVGCADGERVRRAVLLAVLVAVAFVAALFYGLAAGNCEDTGL
jgi:hypothetical protein